MATNCILLDVIISLQLNNAIAFFNLANLDMHKQNSMKPARPGPMYKVYTLFPERLSQTFLREGVQKTYIGTIDFQEKKSR